MVRKKRERVASEMSEVAATSTDMNGTPGKAKAVRSVRYLIVAETANGNVIEVLGNVNTKRRADIWIAENRGLLSRHYASVRIFKGKVVE